ncbi:hypothetical protein [Sphingomonas sp. LT1P40]|uniref:hypothetical protein n=1 Tax=Alteristakelama amylovorans TaxID=3096166 RepID=UPI002FC5BDB1
MTDKPYARGAAMFAKLVCATAAFVVAPGSAMPSFPIPAAIGQTTPKASDRALEARLTKNIVTLPIVMVREFPFVEGEVAGIRGKFMLDTGMQDALVINDHRVPLVGGTVMGTGFFGSGQTFDVRLHAVVKDIRIGNIHLSRVTSVRSQDARMLETITPDFLGWVGYNFFRDHALKMDYRRSKATFYKDGPRQYLRGEKVIAVLPFETRKLPNHPLLPARIGELNAIVSLDTGMNGALIISDAGKARLLANGHLRATAKSDAFDLARVTLADTIDIDLHSIEVEEGPSPAAKSIGITEDTEIELGYAFLKQYKTVWDFRQKKLYLLAR